MKDYKEYNITKKMISLIKENKITPNVEGLDETYNSNKPKTILQEHKELVNRLNNDLKKNLILEENETKLSTLMLDKNNTPKQISGGNTGEGDVVIDPCAGSGSTLLAAAQCRRKAYGFEIKKDFYKDAQTKVLRDIQQTLF